MSKKDQLKQAFSEINSQPKKQDKPTQPAPITPIEPLSLDPSKRPNNRTILSDVKPPKKKIKATLGKSKWGVIRTTRYSFEITPELKEKLNKRIAEIQLTTGKKVSASEIIRQALARELREL